MSERAITESAGCSRHADHRSQDPPRTADPAEIRTPTVRSRRLAPAGEEADIAEVLEAGPAVGAWDGDRLVGFARALSDGHHAAYVEDVMVHEEYRGSGPGTKILARLLEEAGGVGQVSLFCEPDATRFYEGYGFRAALEHVIMHRGDMEG